MYKSSLSLLKRPSLDMRLKRMPATTLFQQYPMKMKDDLTMMERNKFGMLHVVQCQVLRRGVWNFPCIKKETVNSKIKWLCGSHDGVAVFKIEQ
eukprot:Filipodium_phascolosomae@DN4898_c0_g1_i1.p1